MLMKFRSLTATLLRLYCLIDGVTETLEKFCEEKTFVIGECLKTSLSCCDGDNATVAGMFNAFSQIVFDEALYSASGSAGVDA